VASICKSPFPSPYCVQESAAAAAGSSGLKVEALHFMRLALASGASAPPAKDLKQLTLAVLPCANERYYKVRGRGRACVLAHVGCTCVHACA